MVQYSQSMLHLFTRDLTKLKEELHAYTSERNIWQVAPGIGNSAGNLSLHLMGNLNHFIGAALGNTGYIRHRDAEFSTKDVPRATLIADIDKTIEMLKSVLEPLSNEDLNQTFSLEIAGTKDPIGHVLVFLFGHLDYHLGQINYHRRLLDK